MKTLQQLIPFLLISFLIYSCGEGYNEQTTNEETDSISVQMPDMAEFEFYKIIVNMPTPLDELGHMSNDDVPYNANLLAPLDKAETHTADHAIALNCGIYIVDMTYQAVYHDKTKILQYCQTAHDLANKIGVAQVFDDLITDNVKQKLDDKDSLQIVIEKGLEALEDYLVDNSKLPTATQLLVGSWVEMQYILTQSIMDQAAEDIANDLKEHIFSQREHLDNLLILLHEVKDEAGLHAELDKLNQLEASFTKIHQTDDVSHEILVEVAAEIKEIRMDLLAM
ncbi:MAG: hypothetical protein MK207_01840 [Saprospiraceae bacterium]|nr:hypothetical protein [Saprospiraceae bacterium]